MNQRRSHSVDLDLADPEPSVAAVLDAVPRPLLVLEGDGRVLAANRCWHDGAPPSDPIASAVPGDDLADRCDRVAASGGDLALPAARVAEGVRQVLAGRVERCEAPYATGGDAGPWQLVVISRIPNGAVVTRTDPEAGISSSFDDPTTGLPNRSLVLDRIKMALIRAERSSSWPALLLVDLSGPLASGPGAREERDHAVAEVGRRLVGALREGDTCGRWGDHELVLLAELTDPAALAGLVDRVQASLTAPVLLARGPVDVVAHIGVVLAHGTERVDQLVEMAEAARREAARSGATVSIAHSLGS